MGLKQFAAEIIEGPGGLNDFIEREMVVYSVSDRVFAAEWAIKCLANPRCEGSDIAVAAILKRRGIQDELDAVPSLRARLAASGARVAELEHVVERMLRCWNDGKGVCPECRELGIHALRGKEER